MSYLQTVQQLVDEYESGLGGSPMNVREAAAHLYHTGKLKPQISQEIDILVKDISRALRTRYFVAPNGRRVRRKHCVRYKEMSPDGSPTQLTLWWDIDLAPPDFMLHSFKQRRTALVDGCWQLTKDVEYFNSYKNKAAPIQVLMDFREDMEDRQMMEDDPSSDTDE